MHLSEVAKEITQRQKTKHFFNENNLFATFFAIHFFLLLL